jgi:hypothetical protein
MWISGDNPFCRCGKWNNVEKVPLIKRGFTNSLWISVFAKSLIFKAYGEKKKKAVWIKTSLWWIKKLAMKNCAQMERLCSPAFFNAQAEQRKIIFDRV